MEILTTTRLKELLPLRDRSARSLDQCFLIEGEKLISEAVRSGWSVRQILVTERFLQQKPYYLEELQPCPPVILSTTRQMERLSEVVTPPHILAVVERAKSTPLSETNGNIVCLAGVGDPGNLGTMLRTADWFGVHQLLVSGDTVDPFNAKAVRASMGSLFHLAIHTSSDLTSDLLKLKRTGYFLIATSAHCSPGLSAPLRTPFCLILGSESHGLTAGIEALADASYAIPRQGQVESLNVSVSLGIALFALSSPD